jgi:hypothetical protein
MESLAKILDFIGKYAWAVCLTIAFVLFVPTDAARDIGILELRIAFKGPLWIAFVLTAVIAIGSAFQYFDSRIVEDWLKHKRETRLQAVANERDAHERREKAVQEREQAEAADRRAAEVLTLRLRSLDLNESMWIKYCLFHNVQTLSGERGNRTAQSLRHKGILEEGSGHILDLPFHFPDAVWQYLLSHKEDFLPDAERNDKRFPGALENFRKSLWANY